MACELAGASMSGMAPAAVRLDRVARSAPWAAAFGFGLV